MRADRSLPMNRKLAIAFAAAALVAACSMGDKPGAETGSQVVDTTGVTAVGSGTGAGDSANAAGTGTATMPMDSSMRHDTMSHMQHDTAKKP